MLQKYIVAIHSLTFMGSVTGIDPDIIRLILQLVELLNFSRLMRNFKMWLLTNECWLMAKLINRIGTVCLLGKIQIFFNLLTLENLLLWFLPNLLYYT